MGGRIISSLDVPIGDQVAALASVLTDFENDMLCVRTKNAVKFGEYCFYPWHPHCLTAFV